MTKRLSTLAALALLMTGAAMLDAQRMGMRSGPGDTSTEVIRSQSRDLPASLNGLRLGSPIRVEGADPTLSRGEIDAAPRLQVIVRLKTPPLARGGGLTSVRSDQAGFVYRSTQLAPTSRVIAQTQIVLNAVFLEMARKDIPALASDPDVLSIKPVKDYRMELSETVPYVGATALQDMGVDGEGLSIAVLDSGIDYTHEAFGGRGTISAYIKAYGTDFADVRNTVRDNQFPSDRVVEGYDFVGEFWVGGPDSPPLQPDDDPIPSPEAGTFGGHGTHVADIAGGSLGVAPGVDLYAVKVCASASTACSGVALIQGMEFAVDPNGDKDPSDAVDIINMSLGAGYGDPFDDDLSQAVDNASALGVLTVSSAGNGSDKPYVQGTPSAAPTALAVAQTHVPSAALQAILVKGTDPVPAVFQSWSAPLTETISAEVVYGEDFGSALGCSTGADPNSVDPGDAPYPPGTFSGEIVLVDRGVCNFSIKIFNIQRGGGGAGIIGMVNSDPPFNGSLGAGGPFTIPGYMISQANATAIKNALPTGGEIDPANGIPQVMTMVGSSSRGPQIHDNSIKPEIGAPGASVSADSGSGTGTSGFGGTSGASPMVAGAAALLLDARNVDDSDSDADENIGIFEAKALLMNTAETDILNDVLTGLDAPITRIGGGELRVDRAARSAAAAWDNDMPSAGGALSFGFADVSARRMKMTKRVRVRNRSEEDIEFAIIPTFRSPGPETTGAIQVMVPDSIVVESNEEGDPGRDAVFRVTLVIDGALLPPNMMNSGSVGNLGDALTLNEFDGYLLLEPMGERVVSSSGEDSDSEEEDDLVPESIHVAWHLLPRQAAKVRPSTMELTGGDQVIRLKNRGIGVAQNDSYSLLVLSEDIPEGGPGEQAPTPDIAAVGINTIPVPAGFCSAEDSFLWLFAINSWERQRHLIQPVSYQITLDTNQDGKDDFVVLNRDLSFDNISDGRQVTWAQDLSDDGTSAFFFAEHAMNTGNTVLIICGEQIGLTGTDILSTNVDITSIFAQDWYYGGPGDEVVAPGKLTVTPLGEQYFGIPEDVPGFSSGILEVLDFGPWPGNTPELGLLLFTNGDRGGSSRGGATEDTEALIFLAPELVEPRIQTRQ